MDAQVYLNLHRAHKQSCRKCCDPANKNTSVKRIKSIALDGSTKHRKGPILPKRTENGLSSTEKKKKTVSLTPERAYHVPVALI